MLVVATGGCRAWSGTSSGPIRPPPFVVHPLPACPAPVITAAARQVAVVIDWQGSDTDHNHLTDGVVVTAAAPVIFEQSDGTVPMSLSTRPPGALCALGPLEREPGSTAQVVKDRQTVVFLRDGSVEVDLAGDEDGTGTHEPLYLRVHAPTARTRVPAAPGT